MSSLKTDWTRVARLLLTARAIDALEEKELTPQGKVTYQFSSRGHDLAQILLGLQLTHPHDAAGVYYRSRAFMLAAGLTSQEALAADMARTGSPSEGRDVGVVFSMAPRGGVTVLPSSGDVGAQYTPLCGWAQAIAYRARYLKEAEWEGALAVVLGGDGSTAANGFWASLNIATTLHLPLLFFIEDNSYAISVPSTLQTPGTDIAQNLSSFAGLTIMQCDGGDPAAAAERIAQAGALVRERRGPVLLRLKVPRLAGHSFADNQAYKSAEQRADEDARDPLPRLKQYQPNLDWARLEQEAEAEVRQALALAEGNPEGDPATATDHLFYAGQPQQVGGRLPEERAGRIDPLPAGSTTPRPAGPRINLLDAVRRVLESELALNDRALVFGEDVGLKGGVHGATIHLQNKFTYLSTSGSAVLDFIGGKELPGLRALERSYKKFKS